MPPRMPTSRCGCGCGSAPRLPFERATRVYEMVDRPLVPVVGADGARRRQGRPRGAEEPVGRIRRPDRRARGADLRRGRLQVHDRQPAAARRHPVRQDGPEGRPQGQVGHLVDRRHRARAARRARACRSPSWCSTGASSPSSNRPIPTRCRSRSTSDTGRVHTSYSLSGAQTGRLSSTDPNLRTSRSAPRSAGGSATPSSPSRAMSMLAADYSQIELRLAAHIADVPQLRAAFARGEDIHNMTASELFGEVNRDTRARGQDDQLRDPLRHLALGPGGAARRHRRRGAGDHRPLFRALPGHHAAISPTRLPEVRETGFTTTLFGRKTHFPRIKSQGPARAPGRRARRDQRADPGHQRRHHQARDGADGPGARRGGARRHADADAGP